MVNRVFSLEEIGVRDARGRAFPNFPKDHKTVCPKCSHRRKPQNRKDPCLSVSVKHDDWVIFCHNCGWSHGKGGETNRSSKEYVRPKFEPAKPTDALIEFFKSRGITKEVVERNRVSLTQKWMPGNEDGELSPVIAFPYLRDGEIINVKYRTRDKRFMQEKHAEKIFYGLDDIKDETTCVIVEGEIDKMSWEVAGFTNVISVPDGAPKKELEADAKKMEYIPNCEEYFKNKTKVYIATDMDDQGNILAEELARRIGKERCLRIQFPSDCNDSNDTLKHHGGDALKECMEYAQPYPIEGVYTASDYTETVLRFHREGRKRGLSTGWENVDRLLSVVPGQLWVVTGYPGSGKSEFIDAMTMNLARRNEWVIGICSFENPGAEHVIKLSEKFLELPFWEGPRRRMDTMEVNRAIMWLNYHYRFIQSDNLETETTVDWILQKAKAAVLRDGLNVLVVDPYNFITQIRAHGQREDEFIKEMLRKFKQFANIHGVTVILVAHPSKPPPDKQNKPPGPYSISGGANFYNMADVMVTVHRDKTHKTRETEIHVTKVRFKWVGIEGVCYLEYDRATGVYTDTGRDNDQLNAGFDTEEE